MAMQNEGPAAREGSADLNWKVIVGVVVVALAAVFVLQNTDDVEINFLLWDFTFGMWFALLIALALGIAIGWGLSVRSARKKKKAAKRKS